MPPKTRTSPRQTRASTQAARLASTATNKTATKSSSPTKRTRQPSPRRNTITIKKVLLTSSSGSTVGNSTGSHGGKSVSRDDQMDIDLESDESVLSGPEGRDDDVDTSDASSDSITDGDDMGVPDFEQIINAPQPKTLVTSSGRLTARQRAMLDEGASNEEAVEEASLLVPTKRALTEEELLQKSEVARRRKHQREQALEERKVATIHRILAKQNARRAIGQRGRPKGVVMGKEQESVEDVVHVDSADAIKTGRQACEEYLRRPMQPGSVRCHLRGTGSYIVVPEELLAFPEPKPIKNIRCACCGKDKRYTHPVTGVPVCSLECYKQIEVK